jgi:uncharacterized membrane protein
MKELIFLGVGVAIGYALKRAGAQRDMAEQKLAAKKEEVK